MGSTENGAEQTTTHRVVTAAFGLLFIVLAILVYVESDRSASAVVAALILGGLGLDAMISAFRGRKSLLARIGPLP